ncbi:MAG: hypothetical protein GY786_07860, partial [Proteobacteria bacterium]|nr:hypothetical protein [Pseudomonadota bacterium]
MKKIALITLVLLLGIFVNSSFAVEVSLYGPEKYIKTGRGPTVHTDIFTVNGISGPGKIIITNHGKKWWKRIRFAKIWLNGQVICKPPDFKGFPNTLTKVVNLQETNEIKVKLWGWRGKKLSIELTQEVEADAAKVCGPEGCNIEGSIANIEVPPGALSQNLTLAISEPIVPPKLPNGLHSCSATTD